MLALEQIAEHGARNVLITHETGCFALLREDAFAHALPASAPPRRASLGRRLAGMCCWRPSSPLQRGRPAEEALRAAVATGAASTLEVGAGRFDPREADRLAHDVQVVALQPAIAER